MLHICKATRDKALQRYTSLSAPYEGVMIDFQRDIICLLQRMCMPPAGPAASHGRILAASHLFKIQKIEFPIEKHIWKRRGAGFYRSRRSFAS